jgi:hypothetical protein
MKEVVIKECGLFSSRDTLKTAIEDSREMLNRSVKDSSKIVVETALYLIVNTIAKNYKLYEIEKGLDRMFELIDRLRRDIKDYFSHNPKEKIVAVVLLDEKQYRQLLDCDDVEGLYENSVVEVVERDEDV